MGGSPRIEIDVHLDDSSFLASMPDEVQAGLTATPKTLPSKYFYDERGSVLFERITRLPEYYLTRAEQALLSATAPAIARLARPREILELGSGSARKTRLLIEAARAEGALRRFLPFDVSREIAEASARDLARRYPRLEIHAVVGDFERHLDRVPPGRRRLVAFLGSTLGNFPDLQAIELLQRVAGTLDADGTLLLGVDLVKDSAVLHAAYNDRAGITAEFNRNILWVVNDHLDADFDPQAFEHEAFYDRDLERVEMHLRSRRPQRVRLGAIDLQFELTRDERIRTEVSCKYTRASLERILSRAGFRIEHWFSDPRQWFALVLARRVD